VTAGYPICAALIIVRSRFPPIDSKVKKEFPDERILRETFGHGRQDEAYGLRISENFWLRIAVIIQSDYKDLAPPPRFVTSEKRRRRSLAVIAVLHLVKAFMRPQ
jgi:hypothetical protein